MVSDTCPPESGGEPRTDEGSDDRTRRHGDADADADVPASTLLIAIDGVDSTGRARRRHKIVEQVAWVVSDTVRDTDLVYRHGEVGFCVVLAGTPESEAVGAGNRVRRNVELMPLLADAGVTVTVGVAAGGDDDLAATIARAEQALATPHEANQVICAEDPTAD